jgi:hypothetical protein
MRINLLNIEDINKMEKEDIRNQDFTQIVFRFRVYLNEEDLASNHRYHGVITDKALEFVEQGSYFDDYDELNTTATIRYCDYLDNTNETIYEIDFQINSLER